MIEIWAGFLIGFFGSLHCIGMCGPIALALPSSSNNQLRLILERTLYNLGRIITYSFFGFLFGFFGKHIVLFGFQQNLSITLGILILVGLFTPRSLKNRFLNLGPIKLFNDNLKLLFGKMMRSNSSKSFLAIGILNGFLPCGLVYVGIAGSMNTGDPIQGALFMAAFGFGTFPMMFAASMLGKFVNMEIKRKINRLIPTFAAILAVLFILRGLNLGIPYISPKFESKPVEEQMLNCH
ncbi:MAG: sulfite exporter TauE/SafE family protein [Melioribacteraceae bacterium]|nr:sulfite exporter TauE/SafE family protein [Melioribacteraceae bacterium]MCF8263346.1 sulfite exporter TauE/SafE family protein [Melioribacteraceae bacterium]MCF8432029.1 sulfite exporter TauE/SafE family protein [Melioribacteraceae bacterium]